MIIRSQDKRAIIFVSNTDTIKTDIYGDVCSFNGEDSTQCKIADYSTKEKAIKVLDMICEQYQYCQECKCGLVGINKPDFVFQMPQDDDKCFKE